MRRASRARVSTDEIAHRLADALRMLRDDDEVNAHMSMNVQLLDVRRRLLACGRRWVDALGLIDDDQVVRLRVHMPLPQPRFINFDVLDGKVANAIDQHATPFRKLRQQPHRIQRLTATRHPCNQRDHLLNTIFVVDVSR